MIVKSKKSTSLLPEGNHMATVSSVMGKPNNEAPKKIIIRYKVNGHGGEAVREVPNSFEERTPLRKDAEALLGRQLTAKEAEEGVDLEQFINSRCQIVVTHKTGVGGKPMAVVTLVQPAPVEVAAAS